MTGKSDPITIADSASKFDSILRGNKVVIVDFYADWCGPCKAIAPMFADLAKKHAKPGQIAFCKVNVDNNQETAKAYGVTAMPTFISFVNGTKFEEMRGAGNLRGFVANAVQSAPSAPTFQGAGRTLGGSAPSGASRRSGQTLSGPSWWAKLSAFNMANAFLTFFGLYFFSLFSFDPYKAAEASPFNVHAPKPPPTPISTNGQRVGGATRPGGVRTLADLGGS